MFATIGIILRVRKKGRKRHIMSDWREFDLSVHVTVWDERPESLIEHQDKVFLQFYRLDGSRACSTGGSGLGLSIVKTVIDAHDGRVELRNMPGKGLEVIVSLPPRV